MSDFEAKMHQIRFRLGPVFILGLSGGNSPKISEIPPQKKFKMNYAKIEFLSISGVIFSPAYGASPQTPTGALPLVQICVYCLNCTTFCLVDYQENH